LVGSAIHYRSRLPAIAALAVLAAYVAFDYMQRQRALEFAARHARPGTQVDVQPRPVSPFNWTVFVSDDESRRFAHVYLERKEARPYQPGDGFIARIDAAYMPLEQAIWVTRSRYGEIDQARTREAWNTPALAFFRWFATEPAYDGASDGGKCAWFVDLRFVTPGRDITPFQFGACRDTPEEPWRAYERTGPDAKVLPR
jgi:inner membrane protein